MPPRDIQNTRVRHQSNNTEHHSDVHVSLPMVQWYSSTKNFSPTNMPLNVQNVVSHMIILKVFAEVHFPPIYLLNTRFESSLSLKGYKRNAPSVLLMYKFSKQIYAIYYIYSGIIIKYTFQNRIL